MTKVTILDQPSAAIAAEGDARSISQALAEGVMITDAKNRRLKLKRPTILQESRLIRVLGEDAENPTYLNAYALPAAMVVEIDGEPVNFPSNQIQLDAVLQRLDREGMAAVIQYITSKPAQPTEETTAIKN